MQSALHYEFAITQGQHGDLNDGMISMIARCCQARSLAKYNIKHTHLEQLPVTGRADELSTQ